MCRELGRAVSAAGRWPWPSVQQVPGGAGPPCGSLWNAGTIPAPLTPAAVAPAPLQDVLGCPGMHARKPSLPLVLPVVLYGPGSLHRLFPSESAWQVRPQPPAALSGGSLVMLGLQLQQDQGWMGMHPSVQSPGLSQGRTWYPKRPARPAPA